MYGRRCGIEYAVRDKPNLVYFDMGKCANVFEPYFGCQSPHICVKICPTKKNEWICDDFIDAEYFDNSNVRDKGYAEMMNRCTKSTLLSKPSKFQMVILWNGISNDVFSPTTI